MNLELYNKVKTVPENAKKTITGGRLKGMTDINPMWRIRTLTEQFGPCGVGWFYRITDKRLQPGANGEIAAFVDIELCVRIEGEWSVEIPGTGGSMFVSSEKNGLYTSDEAFKMALTDALSVACKALGFGADVYWNTDNSKYSGVANRMQSTGANAEIKSGINAQNSVEKPKCSKCGKEITANEHGYSMNKYKAALCRDCQRTQK